MKLLTSKSTRAEIEQMALEQIMSQLDDFTVNQIIKSMRAICDEDIETAVIEEVVFNAIDYCLMEGYIDIYDRFSYLVNPIKQIEFSNSKAVDLNTI